MTDIKVVKCVSTPWLMLMYYHFYWIKTTDKLPLDQLKDQLLAISDNICIFNGDRIICKEQILSALHRVEQATKQNNLISKTWGIEVVLEISAERQIKLAIDFLDIVHSKDSIIVIIKGEVEIPEPLLELLQDGLPEFKNPEQLINLYGLKNSENDLCKQIISKASIMRL
jgi:tRNA threonylcarbamoyladenosine modification (KEOPS) complex Cgi121 subunit